MLVQVPVLALVLELVLVLALMPALALALAPALVLVLAFSFSSMPRGQPRWAYGAACRKLYNYLLYTRCERQLIEGPGVRPGVSQVTVAPREYSDCHSCPHLVWHALGH